MDIVKQARDYLAQNAAESGADVLIAGMADEIERLRAVLLRAYKFVSPLSDPLPITNREMAAELMAALEQNATDYRMDGSQKWQP